LIVFSRSVDNDPLVKEQELNLPSQERPITISAQTMSDPIENWEDLFVAIIRYLGSWIGNNCTWIEDLCVAIIRAFGKWTRVLDYR
jgi:hypothetical protein